MHHCVLVQSEVRFYARGASACARIAAQINNEPLEIHADELASI